MKVGPATGFTCCNDSTFKCRISRLYLL